MSFLNFLLQADTLSTATGASILSFFLPLLNNAPAFAILLYFSWRSLKNQDKQTEFMRTQLVDAKTSEKAKDAQIKDLNDYIRSSEKENLELLSELNSVIDNLMNNVRLSNESVHANLEKQIQMLKQHLDAKIATLTEELKASKKKSE